MSPQAAVAWRVSPGQLLYASVGRGFKAGGFNPASPAGSESYGEERAWNAEGGLKTTWADGRVSLNAAAFRISWDDMQLNVPNPYVPAQFYIANVGHATSTGVELEARARPHRYVDLFAMYGLTHGRFGDGSRSSGADVSGNELPNAPGYTASLGVQLSRAMKGAVTCYGRADVVFYGAYHYDDQNTQGQDAYSLANIRAGLQVGKFGLEGWVRNAFDNEVHPGGVCVPGLCALGIHGRERPPAHVRSLAQRRLLKDALLHHRPGAQHGRPPGALHLGALLAQDYPRDEFEILDGRQQLHRCLAGHPRAHAGDPRPDGADARARTQRAISAVREAAR